MKIMNRTLKRTILLAFSLALMMVIPVAAEDVGVEVGDWAKYGNFSYTWNMPTLAGEPPSEFGVFNEVDWTKVEVQNVDGTNVTVEFTTHFESGTEDSETNSGYVETSSRDLPFIIEAHLNPGDEIPWTVITGWNLYINGTTSRTYARVSRSVNYIDITKTGEDSAVALKLYWDKTKGILCEFLFSVSMTFMGTPYSMLLSFKMTETNMWSAGLLPAILTEYWVWAIIVPVIAAICIVVFVVRKRASHSTLPPPP